MGRKTRLGTTEIPPGSFAGQGGILGEGYEELHKGGISTRAGGVSEMAATETIVPYLSREIWSMLYTGASVICLQRPLAFCLSHRRAQAPSSCIVKSSHSAVSEDS